MKLKPETRLAWAWATSACALGLLLSAYVAYAAWPLIGGAFSTAAAITLGVFAAFGVFHFVVLYTRMSPGKQAKSD